MLEPTRQLARHYLNVHGVPPKGWSLAEELEAKGWKEWLTTIFPFAFPSEFSWFHAKFWENWWEVCQSIKHNRPIPPKKLNFLLLWGRALAKCLDGDTQVALADGTHKSIREIEVGDAILSYNETSGRFERDRIVNKWATGRKECLEIVLRSGKVLTLTPEHRVLSINGWKTASELEPTHRIASPRKLDIDPTETSRTDEEVRLLAYFIAEGCTREHVRKHGRSSNLTAAITNGDVEIVEDIAYCAEAVGFGAKVTRKANHYNVYFSKGARDWIRANRLAGKLATQKRIPDWVFRLPQSQKWQFISAFIDTDGWIGQNGKIGITLANKPLIHDLQNLLLQVGVPSTFKYRHNAFAGAWQLMLDNEAVNSLGANIILKAKAAKLERHLGVERYSLLDTYPYEVLRGLPFGVGKSIQRAGLSITHKYSATRRKLRKAIQIYPHPKWIELEKADVLWDEIISISSAGQRETFDVEVERNHNLITNNLISHNSSSGTPSTLMKAAFAGRTYSIYLSETIDQSSSHLANIRNLITHPDSRLVEFYPHLELTPLVPTSLGLKSKDTENVFITKGGSIFRALGIESAARGLILAGKRPDDFNIDDIDDVSHGIMVSKKNLRRLTRSVLLTRDTASDLVVTTKILQNIVTETGVVNQIHTGKSDAFAERTTIGVVNTFEKLDLENYIDDNGMMRNRILPTSIPSWEAVSIPKAQAILDLVGLDSFLAECQNKFDQFRAGRVISNYDEDVQIITWSDFERVFGQRRIPAHWKVLAGLDVGFTEGEYPHYSAWDFIATAAMNSPLPNSLFLYRSRTFKGVSIDDQADAIKGDLYPEEMQMVKQWQLSHEASGVMLTLQQRHRLPFCKSEHYGAEDGVAQWQHLSMSDTSKPHPFFPDELDDDGKYLLGRPTLFYIVDDDQRVRPRDDRGLMILREQVSTWEYVQVKLTDAGQTVQKPSKVNDDHADVIKGLLGYWGANATALTSDEQVYRRLEETFPLKQIAEMQVNEPEGAAAMAMTARMHEEKRLREQIEKENAPPQAAWMEIG